MDALNTFIINAMAYMNNWLWLAFAAIIFVITLIGTHPLGFRHDATFIQILLVYARRTLLCVMPIMMLLFPLALWLGYSALNTVQDSQRFLNWYVKLGEHYWRLVLAAYIGALLLRFIHARYIIPRWSNIKRLYRANVTSDKLSDVREEKNHYNPKSFDPSKYYKEGYIFYGLNTQEQPIYIPLDSWLQLHQQIVGPTRYGKGILLGVQIAQAIQLGNCVIYIDPKGDEYLPHIMADTAKKYNRDFVYCDLNDDGVGGWHPFTGGNIRNIRARLLTAFGLEDTGRESDFYKIMERKVLDKIIPETTKIYGLIQKIESSDHLSDNAKRTYGKLMEWAQVKSLNPKGDGFSVERSMLNNAVVYIKGSLDDKVVKDATRVLIMEIIQEAKRLKANRKTHLTLAIDELRFLASNALIDASATIAGLNANLIFAYQSMTDIRNLEDININALAAEKSINTNCQIKFLYGTQDPDTAEYAEQMSGDIQKLVTRMEHTEVGHLGGEAWEGHRTLSNEKEAYITKNVMLSLPNRVGVLFLPSQLPQVIFTSFVNTDKSHIFDKQHLLKSSGHQQKSGHSEKPAKKTEQKLNMNTAKKKKPKGVKIDDL